MFAVFRREKTLIRAVMAYYLMLFAFLVASYLPDYRIWGLGHWSYFSDNLKLVLFAVGFVFPWLVLWFYRKQDSSTDGGPDFTTSTRGYWFAAIVLTIVFGVGFFVLRARTHFLGDGYTLLANLASDQPIVKIRNFGVMMTHMLLYEWLPGEGEKHALLVYRIVSFGSGLAFFTVAFVSAPALFEKTTNRLLFALGLISGGYSLQFFGYAEHYSMFIVSVAMFGVVGVLVMTRRINRWWIVPPLALSIFLHVLGITLIPAAVFAIAAHSRLGALWSNFSTKSKWLVTVAVGMAGFAVLYYIYSAETSLRFAVIPIVTNRFTTDHYTLFSGRHFLDMINLVFLLIPGLLVLLAGMVWRRSVNKEDRTPMAFLIISILSTAGAAFIFDPTIGVPRDWDLLAFSAVPIAVFIFYYAVAANKHRRLHGAVIVLAIGLGVLSVFSRAYGQVDADLSIKKLKSYVRLDPQRNRRALNLLFDYYNKVGDSTAAQAEIAQWDTTFPEWSINRHGKHLLDAGKFPQAMQCFSAAIELNPCFGPAYSNLGTTHLYMRQYDSAKVYLTIANRMNPYSSTVLANLGGACCLDRDYEKAEGYLLKAIRLDSTMITAHLSLASVYWDTGREDDCLACLVRVSTYPGAPLESFEELAALYVRRGQYDEATETIQLAIAKGMDSVRVEKIKTRYPMLPL